MLKTYIEWQMGGRFFAESTSAEVPTRTAPLTAPSHAAGYRFYTRRETLLDGEILTGQPFDHSPWHYFGTEYNLAQLALEHGANSILYGNVAGNGYTRAVRTVMGNWYPLNDGDTVGAVC